MPRYRDQKTGEVSFVGSPDLNPQLVAGKELIPEGVDTTTLKPITVDSISPVSPTQFQSPSVSNPTVPDPSGYTPLQPSAEESDVSKRIKEIMGESSGLAQEVAAFQAEETKRQGFAQTQQEENDQFSRLKQLQAEFQNLEAEDTRIEGRLQQESKGQGITRGGIAPFINMALRENFLRKTEKAAEANIAAALLAATQNKLLTAQKNIDNAIQAKYGVRQASLATNISNLELLLKDPTLSIAEKNRAEQRLAIQKKNEADLAKKKEDAQKAIEWGVDAKKKGATAKEAQAIIDIGTSENPDLQKAFELYAPFAGVETPDTYQVDLGNRVAIYDKRTNREVASLVKGLTPEQAGKTGVPGQFINEFGEFGVGTNPPKDPTAGEQTGFLFFQRMKDAADVINAYPSITLDESLLKQALLNQNYAVLQTPEQQVVAQAMRQFTEARLRKDSGAAIPESEFANDRRTYFPQVGEESLVLERKAKARENALNALRQVSGNAYWNFYGQNPRDVGQKLLRGEGPKYQFSTDEDKFDGVLLGVKNQQSSTPAAMPINNWFSQLWDSIF